MTPFLQLAISLVFIITAAKLGGYLSYQLGQPAVLGELVAGIILGPSLLNIMGIPVFTDAHLPEVISQLAEIGVLLLMFLAGLDLHISDLLKSGKVAALAGAFGVILPLLLGTVTGMLFSMPVQSAVFLGLVLSATSVSISAQTLMELKVLRSRVGISLLGAAVFDDILVLLVLSIFLALMQPGSSVEIGGVLLTLLKMILFLGISSLIGWWAIPKLSRSVSKLPISQGLIAFAFVALLLYGWASEVFGQMAAITGAFLAGLWFGRSKEKERIQTGVSTIAYGIFVPIFFINIGVSANARELSWESSLFLLIVVLVAVISKVLGSGFGAFIAGFTRRESLQLGVGMVSRGEVGLIVAAIGVNEGLLQKSTFSVIVVVVIITTILTPLMLKAVYPKNKTHDNQPIATPEGGSA